jgi:alcohol dehydrogenase class IV
MQKEYVGRGSIKNLTEELERFKARRIFLVTARDSHASCGARIELECLLRNYELVKFSASPNPTFEKAMLGAKLFAKAGCDLIIAVGGGSAIDVAKSINAFQSHFGKELALATGMQSITHNLAPMMAIPTTAGTGSESTHFAVIYVDGKKYSLADPGLLPDVAIVDAVYTDSLPPYITACVGFDALSQSIESYWAAGASEESRKYASQAIELLIENLVEAVTNGGVIARDKMMHGSHLAGKAINISKTTAPHALSYSITTEFGLPHGHACALTLGGFFTLNESLGDKATCGSKQEFLSKMQQLYNYLGVNSAIQARELWYSLMKACRLEFQLSAIGILSPANIDKIIAEVNLERLENHPVRLSAYDLRQLFDDLKGPC